MKLAINQPYFFPYVGYFQLIESVDKFIIYENVQFVKRSWLTRNRLLDMSNGNPFGINIPVHSNHQIKDVTISTNDKKCWKTYLLNRIYHNYRKAVHFEDTYHFFDSILKNINTNSLHILNSKTTESVCNYLGINTVIQYKNDNLIPLEQQLQSNHKSKDFNIKTDRIFAICKKEKAKHYVNLPSGKALYSKDIFTQHDISLHFLEIPNIKYKQFKHEFVPHLSIIDVLMHNGKERTMDFVQNYQLND